MVFPVGNIGHGRWSMRKAANDPVLLAQTCETRCKKGTRFHLYVLFDELVVFLERMYTCPDSVQTIMVLSEPSATSLTAQNFFLNDQIL